MTGPNDRHDEQERAAHGQDAVRSNAPHPGEELLNAYVDGALLPQERARIDLHLAGCGECRARLAELRGLVALLAGLPEPRLHRSFQLSPASIAPAPTIRQRIGTRLMPSTPAFRAVAAGLVLLLVAATVGRLLLDSGRDQSTSSVPQVSMKVADTPTAQVAGSTRNAATLPTNQQDAIGGDTTGSDASDETVLATRAAPTAMPTTPAETSGGDAAGAGGNAAAKAAPTPTLPALAQASGANPANAAPADDGAENGSSDTASTTGGVAGDEAGAEIGSTDIAGATTDGAVAGGDGTGTSESDAFGDEAPPPTIEAGAADSVMAASEPSTADMSIAAEPAPSESTAAAADTDEGSTNTGAVSSGRAVAPTAKAAATPAAASPMASPVASPAASPVASPAAR